MLECPDLPWPDDAEVIGEMRWMARFFYERDACHSRCCAACSCRHLCQVSDYAWPVISVFDNDTVGMYASADLPVELSKLTVRIRNPSYG